MKPFTRRTLSLFTVYSAAALVAHAHPGHAGHDGGDFTWDFSHLVTNPLATLGYVALLGVAIWAVASHLRHRRSVQVQSFHKSTESRGN